ncbi:PTS mannose transporter subunit IIA [Enterococcus thailandicus]|uniref:PTS sugar transporter subunit IIA n=1 Tax=Enterococcus thailandicus TaxID=417368 RepID=UPI0022EBD895|nr:PTS mannose transporter subunit IIA [Enterococcus thailandicus]MDA3973909.1 PTS mannose transporter subunit IIA [Enterococcus thailandicus]MDA3976278.1 PTS mannose transporter subunit IIA [Enterococcus thailandicus]MDA3981243.1 PTS mannose transporter subunit IIA [Enterococcus thailandicus]
MKRKLILASHGKLASGIKSSLDLICGEKEIETLDCYLSEEFNLEKEVKKIMERYQDHQLVVVTDLFGGSVNNEFLTYIQQDNFYLVTGMNLPFLIELTMQFQITESLSSLIKETLEKTKQTILFCNSLISNEVEEEEF